MNETTETSSLELEEVAELFRLVYPAFIVEIDRAEATRGKLKEFHLAMAAEHAKNSVRILGWDSRRTLNAIFETYKDIYLLKGRTAADLWSKDTFGCTPEIAMNDPDGARELEAKIEAMQLLIQEKEAELLHLYREIHMLQEMFAIKNQPVVTVKGITPSDEGDPS
ncbi:hypothetical protein [Cohnella nanjingensis]|uniref:Uncharacterized protein n=1 Tax=Cohnella nanjingensis TaxID=1387779 RepID=A0A7X0RZ59_9BACL|nr:hypothetical protein [Cohnella nanjingensis]MBB6674749.1 hypothetical protein [Cohnella nanjingensis]